MKSEIITWRDIRRRYERSMAALALVVYRRHIRWRRHGDRGHERASVEFPSMRRWLKESKAVLNKESKWKRCTGCGEIRAKTDYNKSNAGFCISCRQSLWNRQMSVSSKREKERERCRKYRRENKKKIAAGKRAQYLRRKADGRHLEYKNRRKARLRKAHHEDCSDVYKSVRGWHTWVCEYCGGVFPSSEIHIEHRTPLCRGGDHAPYNMAIACSHCNCSKSTKTLEEFMAERVA